jgi:hypothetical protein
MTDDINLPPLPTQKMRWHVGGKVPYVKLFTADQTQDYARAAVLADRAARAPKQAEPVAWRYQYAKGHYRYRKYVPKFDEEYAILRPVPLYTAPQQAEPVQAEPVAWAWFDINDDGRLAGVLDYEQPPHYTVPLYLAPPAQPDAAREAMRQALNALENATDQTPKPYSTECARSADALRAALKGEP